MLLLAAFLSIVVFLPPEGRVSGPLHNAIDVLLGRAAFMPPLVLACSGVLAIARSINPKVRLPSHRLAGVGVLIIAVLVTEHVLASGRGGTGVIGQWLSSLFLDLLGSAVTALLLLAGLAVGTLLAFDVRLRWPRRQPGTTEDSRAGR